MQHIYLSIQQPVAARQERSQEELNNKINRMIIIIEKNKKLVPQEIIAKK